MNKKRIFLFLSAMVMFVLIAAMSGCRNTVTIIFDDGGNSLTLHVKSGSCVSPPSPEKSGYEFCGWLDKNTGEEFDFSRPITSDVELVAKWRYDRVTVSFDSNGGESVPFQVADRGTYISPPETPTNGYKVFAGWYRQGEDEPFDFSLPVFESVVLVAHWETLMVTVYFDSDGGSVVPAKATEKGERVTPPEPPVREGFDFAGWQTEDGEEFSFEERILSAVTLKAIWRVNSFWVCFDCSGGTEVKNQLVEKGGKAVRPESFRFGYVLLGWYEQDGGEAFDFDVGVYGDVFLTAKWVKTDAFDNLCGEWTGKGATEIGDADYLLVIDQDGGAIFSVERGENATTDNEARIVTSGEREVILFYKSGEKACRLDFAWNGIDLSCEKACFSEPLKLSKTPDALFDPAELAGVWQGTAQADFFGDIIEIYYVLDITFDGKGVLTYEMSGSVTELLIVDFRAEKNLLVVEYVLYEGAAQSYFICFRVDGERLVCEQAIFGEILVLLRKND